MTSLTDKLSDLVGQSFTALELPAELGRVQISDRPDLAQFQCNGAMAAAKIAKKAPRQIAEDIVAALNDNKDFARIEIAGPGFINLDMSDDFLERYLGNIVSEKNLGVADYGAGETVVVDYGGPNVAKAMHVGHLRPTVIGDCLKRIIRAAGYNTLGDVHMGDWGLQMGQIISEFAVRNPQWPYFDPDFTGDYPDTPPFSYEELARIYPEASAACKADLERLEAARQATRELQNGRRGYRALWEHFMVLSKADMKRNFDTMGVHFELWKGEADVNDLIGPLGEELKTKGLAVESEGALVIPVAEEDDNKKVPPLMYFKSDGAATYGTTDLATIVDRVNDYDGLKKLVYVTDKRQNLHFEQVFRAAKKAGYVDNIEMMHIGFGTLNGPDGKPFKTRDGGVMPLADLLAQADKKARQRIEDAELATDMNDDEKADIAHKVAIAAVKYTDLSNQAHVDYAFDLDRMTQFEGKTGPYLLYQAVRIKSLLRKADYQGTADVNFVIKDEDRGLALVLAELPDAFAAALRSYSPHHLCDYVFRLAQEFSSFYASCHILSETDEMLKQSRLALCDMTHRQIDFVLDLLGITVPDRM